MAALAVPPSFDFSFGVSGVGFRVSGFSFGCIVLGKGVDGGLGGAARADHHLEAATVD